MNTPKPTIKNLKAGLVSIKLNQNENDFNLKPRLSLLLELAWPNSTQNLPSRWQSFVYFQSKNIPKNWDAVLAHGQNPNIPAFSVNDFLSYEKETLQKVKSLAENELIQKRIALQKASSELAAAQAVYDKANNDLITVLNIEPVFKLSKEQKAILNQLNAVSTKSEFISILNKLQNL